ncbi:MAG TPA: hypothetical protein VGM98_10305, partial [Schlesneria sp.]
MTIRFSVAFIILVAGVFYCMAEEQSWVSSDAGDPPLIREMANRIEQALRERTKCDFNKTSLEEALRSLEIAHQIPIWLDRQGLQDEGISTDDQVTLVKSNITLQTALALILEPLGLTTLTRDGILVVTTQAKADERMSTRIYPVGDLVNSPLSRESYTSLIVVIQNHSSCQWMNLDQEGGAIDAFPNAQSLVVRQTQHGQR